MLDEHDIELISKFGFDGLIQESTDCLIIHLMTEPDESNPNKEEE